MAREFNREMDRYIGGRRSRKLDFRFPRRQKVVFSDGVELDERPGFWARYFGHKQQIPLDNLSDDEKAKLGAMEREIEKIDEEEQHAKSAKDYERLAEARESALSRFFELMRIFRRRHELEDKAEQIAEAEDAAEAQRIEIDAETKEVLKITATWLTKLPKRYRDDFLASEDYQRYKKVLQRHGLAK